MRHPVILYRGRELVAVPANLQRVQLRLRPVVARLEAAKLRVHGALPVLELAFGLGDLGAGGLAVDLGDRQGLLAEDLHGAVGLDFEEARAHGEVGANLSM